MTDHEAHRPGATRAGEAEALLRRVLDLIAGARPMPLSASVMINREEVVELMEEALERLPEELRSARWLLKERDDFLSKVKREGDEILEAARTRAERMVQRAEVVRAAEHTARRTIDDADSEARRLRHEAEDFCDQRLAQFEIVLDRTMRTVQAGRERLQVSPLGPVDDDDADGGKADDEPFFDQDQDQDQDR